jgi:hypothetical protein
MHNRYEQVANLNNCCFYRDSGLHSSGRVGTDHFGAGETVFFTGIQCHKLNLL